MFFLSPSPFALSLSLPHPHNNGLKTIKIIFGESRELNG
jgi:hypothetical protein